MSRKHCELQIWWTFLGNVLVSRKYLEYDFALPTLAVLNVDIISWIIGYVKVISQNVPMSTQFIV